MSDTPENTQPPVDESDETKVFIRVHMPDPKETILAITSFVVMGIEDGKVLNVFGPFPNIEEAGNWAASTTKGREGIEIHIFPTMIQRQLAEAGWPSFLEEPQDGDEEITAIRTANEFLNS